MEMLVRKLIKERVSELSISEEVSPFFEIISYLPQYLGNLGFKYLNPKCYPGDEWFCGEGLSSISIPFTLYDPQLIRLEKKFVGSCEGSTKRQFTKLLFHEVGHAFDHSYQLSELSCWRNVFGSPSTKYDPDNYKIKPYSKSFARNLPDHYGQSHPTEDFAETFATIAFHGDNWRCHYPEESVVTSKLQYVEMLIKR